MKNNLLKSIIIVVAIFILGVLAGRWSNDKTKIEYVKGETIIDTIYRGQLKPYASIIPNLPILPLKNDTVWVEGKPTPIFIVDTAKIKENYIKENKYHQVLFDNQTDGLFELNTSVQYNEQKQVSYKFTPIKKVVTIKKTRVFVPFLSGSMNSFKQVGVGGGFFYHDLGLEAKYITDFKLKGIEVGMHYKF